jgi:acetate kinase
MDRRSTFAVTTAGRNFCPRPPVLSRRTSLEAAVDKNTANEGVISAAASRVAVRVIRTDEELMIAKTVCQVLGLGCKNKKEN